MLSIIFAVILIIAGFIVGILMKQKAKVCEESAEKREERAKQYEEKGEGWQRDAKEERDTANEYRTEATQYKRKAVLPILGGVILAVVVLVFSMIAIVPTGHTGVKVTFGKVEDTVLPSGLNIILPWQNVVNMDNREQKIPFTLEAFSKDIQQVDVQGSININIDKPTAMNLYKDVGQDYMNILVQPRVLEDVKIVIARYTAENLIENRQKAADAIYEIIKAELAEKGINVISFAIENIDFTDTFEAAVEAKQVATQEKLKAQTEQERQTMEQQQQAERERIKAQAAADVQKIEADAKAYAIKVQADAEAEANEKVAKTLSESLIKYNMVNLWNGQLPFVSSNGMNIIDLTDLLNKEDSNE